MGNVAALAGETVAWGVWTRKGPYRADLVKAGALILAEIERLDRAALLAREEAEHGR